GGRPVQPLLLFGDQTDLINPRLPDRIDQYDDAVVAGVNVAADIDDPIFGFLALHPLLNLVLQIGDVHLVLPDEELIVPRNRYHDRRLFDDRRVFFRVAHLLQQDHRDTRLQKWRHDHEDDEEHQHDVHHRRDVDLGSEAA